MQKGNALSQVYAGLLLFVLIFIPGCSGKTESPVSLPTKLPESTVQGWTIAEEPREFSPETLYDLVDGQADAYFAYGFQQAVVGRYTGPSDARLQIEIFSLDSQADAYGLFTSSRSGVPMQIGVDGDADPGRRIIFWQDRYFVRVVASQPIDESKILAFAQAVAQSLPSGGQAPDLVNRLPDTGLVSQSVLFFHQEISIQSWIWLGGENILGLSPETNGVMATYERGGAGAGYLLLVRYPQDKQADQGRQTLQSADLPDLVAMRTKGNELAAVFGGMNAESARNLLDEVFP